MTDKEIAPPDGGMIAFGDPSPGPPAKLAPDRQRRAFLRTLAAAGLIGVAGCMGGNGRSEPGTTTAGGGNGGKGNDETAGTPGDGSGGDPTGPGDDGPPGSGDPMVLDDDEPFVLPAGAVDSTFDVDLTSETVLIEGSALEAVLEVDPTDHRYVFDAERLAAAELSLSEGSLVWLSGVALRRVTELERDGDRLTVETEFAALNEAISDGEVAWDASLGFGEGQVVRDDADGRVGASSDGAPEGPAPSAPLDSSRAALVDVTMVDRAGTERPVQQLSRSADGISWTFTQDDRKYTFGLTPGRERMELKAEVVAPTSGPVAGDPNIRLTGIGRLKAVKSKANASFSDGDLDLMDYQADQLAGEIKLDVVSAGSGAYNFRWEFPGVMFRWVIFVGALPVIITVDTALIANVHVPANATAKAVSKYSYEGKTGFTYDGTEVSANTEFAGFGFDPDGADSSANVGVAVDLQFGVMFPRMSVSIFGTLLVPYLALEMYIGSSLRWGPVCKKSYVRMRSTAGYDLTVLGVSLSQDEMTLADRTVRAQGDSCPE